MNHKKLNLVLLATAAITLFSISPAFAKDTDKKDNFENITLVDITETDTGKAPLSTAKDIIQDFRAELLQDEQDIGNALDPSDASQFNNTITFYDGNIKPVSSRNLRFINDPSVTSIEEARARFRTEVPISASGFNKAKMTYSVNDKTYKVSYREENGRYYYSQYTLRDICRNNDPTTSGLKTSFSISLTEPGSFTYYVLLPDYEDLTRSFVSKITFHVGDHSGPVIKSVSVNRVNEEKYDSKALYPLSSKDNDNSLCLSVQAKDNVTGTLDEEALTYQWYHDESIIADADKNDLIIPAENESNGSYYCMVSDASGLSTKSDALEIYNFDTASPIEEISVYKPQTLADGTVSFAKVSADDTAKCSYEILSVDYDDLHLEDEPVAITKDTEEIPDSISNLWTHTDKFMITENGEYRIYVRDQAGNISCSEPIKISDIVTAPIIKAVLIEPETDKKGKIIGFNTQQKDGTGTIVMGSDGKALTRTVPYISVTVDAETNCSAEGLQYKLSILNESGSEINVSAKNTADGYQVSPIFDGLTDDETYVLYVKNELNKVSSTRFKINKDFYYATGDDSFYIARLLIQPLSYTNEDVSLGVSFSDCSYVDEEQSVSFDGGDSFIKLTNKESKLVVPENGTYEIQIKDKDGHIHSSGEQIIKNVDKTAPEINVCIAEDNKSFNITASDDLSGLKMLCYTYKDNDGRLSDLTPINVFDDDGGERSYDMTFSMIGAGIYTFYLYDNAGNVCRDPDLNTDGISITVGNVAIANELLKGSDNEIALNILKNITVDNTSLTKDPVNIMFTTLDTQEFANNAYSWDGGKTFTSSRVYEAKENGTYNLLIKDIYGNVYRSGDIEINNIDTAIPGLKLEQQDNKLFIDTYDNESGISNISWKPSGSDDIIPLKDYDDLRSVNLSVSLPCNGAYTVFVSDKAGNIAKDSLTVSNILNITTADDVVIEEISTEELVSEKAEETEKMIEVVTEEESTEERTIDPVNFDNPTGSTAQFSSVTRKTPLTGMVAAFTSLAIIIIAFVTFINTRRKNKNMAEEDSSSLEDTIDSIFSDETGTKSGTESGTHPELPLESEGLNESDLDWF